MKKFVTVNGYRVELSGNEVKPGDTAPDFEVVDQDLKLVKLSSFSGKVCIIASLGSLDTSVCESETKKFNQVALDLGSDVVILIVSMDLPFALSRWCGLTDVNNLKVLSDHRFADFGRKYGVLIPETRLLARAIFIVDRNGKVIYIQLVPEINNEPNYEEVLTEVKRLL